MVQIDENNEVSELRWKYREAAAVLSSFDPRSLRPNAQIETEPAGALRELVDDSTVADGPDGQRWILRGHVRKRTLARLGSRTAMQQALAANPAISRDPLQRALEQCITGVAAPSAGQTLEDRKALLLAVDWLSGVIDRLPDSSELRTQYRLAERLEPLRALVGAHFQGRTRELAELDDYVGVPSRLLARLQTQIRKLMPSPSGPLMIWGPSGIGKSTLVARYLLTHCGPESPSPIPFAYIDFDRPGFESDIALLMPEIVRQVGLQHSLTGSSLDPAGIAGVLREHAPNMPFVLVLDTLERLQTWSDVQPLISLLTDLGRALPELRTVLVSRTPIKALDTRELILAEVDQPAAIALLEAAGVDQELSRAVARRIGGNPLSLRLAAAVIRAEGAEGSAILRGLETARESAVWNDALIQGQLYDRILNHIHDADVRRLAHPGLVLRRLTPDIIEQVLAEPCGLVLEDRDHARRVFEASCREVALVEPQSDGSLRHRADLRRVMLDLMRQSKPEQVRAIDERAVRYYEALPDIQSRAEEIYHRLALGQPAAEIEPRWIPGVSPYLRSAVEELPPSGRDYLAAKLGTALDRH